MIWIGQTSSRVVRGIEAIVIAQVCILKFTSHSSHLIVIVTTHTSHGPFDQSKLFISENFSTSVYFLVPSSVFRSLHTPTMSSRFNFQFAGDDISDDDAEADLVPAQISSPHSTKNVIPEGFNANVVAPKKHSLTSLLSTLPSSVSYSYERISPNLAVPKRDFHDVRTQLLAESEPDGYAEENVVIEALETGDLDAGYYEGGFKTWGCAVELAAYVLHEGMEMVGDGGGEEEEGEGGGAKDGGRGGARAKVAGDGDGDHMMTEADGNRQMEDDAEQEVEEYYHMIELGAGTAIPSLALLVALIRQKQQHFHHGTPSSRGKPRRRYKFTLCDYNFDVLRLATAANVLLAVLTATGYPPISVSPPFDPDSSPDDTNGEKRGNGTRGQTDDVDINEALVKDTQQILRDHGIELEFISGAWNDTTFVDLCLGEDEGEDDLSTRDADNGNGSSEHDDPNHTFDHDYHYNHEHNTGDSLGCTCHLCPVHARDGPDITRNPGSRRRSRRRKTIILASETLYSPATLPVFTATLKALLLRALQAINGEIDTDTDFDSARRVSGAEAFLSSKQIYFGVGGGVEEFRRLTAASGGLEVVETWNSSSRGHHDENDAGGRGVGSVILRVTPTPT